MNRYQLETYIPIPDVVNIILEYMSGTKLLINVDIFIEKYGEKILNDLKIDDYSRDQFVNNFDDVDFSNFKSFFELVDVIENNLVDRLKWETSCFTDIYSYLRSALQIPTCSREPIYSFGFNSDYLGLKPKHKSYFVTVFVETKEYIIKVNDSKGTAMINGIKYSNKDVIDTFIEEYEMDPNRYWVSDISDEYYDGMYISQCRSRI